MIQTGALKKPHIQGAINEKRNNIVTSVIFFLTRKIVLINPQSKMTSILFIICRMRDAVEDSRYYQSYFCEGSQAFTPFRRVTFTQFTEGPLEALNLQSNVNIQVVVSSVLMCLRVILHHFP